MARSMVARTRVPLIELVYDARHGCERSTNELVQQCLPDLEGYLARRGSELPKALANQVMAEFVRALDRLQFDTDQQIWGYVHSIARSRLIDERRRSKPDETPLDNMEVADERQSSFDDRIADQMTVESLISDLTVEQREVIQMRFMEDLSIHETAHRLGKSITAVKGLQHRAIAALAAVAAVVLLLVAVSQLSDDGANYVEIEPTESTTPEEDSAPVVDSDRTTATFTDDSNDPLIIEQIRTDSQQPMPTPTVEQQPPPADEQAVDEPMADPSPDTGDQQVAPADGADGADGEPGEQAPEVNTTTTITPTVTAVAAPSTTVASTVTTDTVPPPDEVADVTTSEHLALAGGTSAAEVAVPLGPTSSALILDPDTFTVWDAPAQGGLRFDRSTLRPTLYFVLPSAAHRNVDDYARYSICASDGLCYQTVLRITFN